MSFLCHSLQSKKRVQKETMAIKKRSSTSKPSRKRVRDNDENNSNQQQESAKGNNNTKNNNNNNKGQKRPPSSSSAVVKSKSANANTQLKIGIIVLIVAIIIGIALNSIFDTSDPITRQFFSEACRHKSLMCARFITTARRTLQTGRPIRRGEILVEIPRSIQLWDIDALRSNKVKDLGLLNAKHRRTDNHLASGAFLAAYLALLIKEEELTTTVFLSSTEEEEEENKNVTQSSTTNIIDDLDPVIKSYLSALPTTVEKLSYHPILWTKEELRDKLGGHSLNYAVVLNHREMVDSEYDAFVTASPQFGEIINATEYKIARLNVLTRSFSPGPINDVTGEDDNLDEEEIDYYQQQLGIDLSQGCHAMVPILDMLNHHPNPNVVYNYNKEKKSFVISAKHPIPSGFELMDSYGKFADSHLFAKYGFVNGDGSGYIFATIAIFHRVLDYDMKSEFAVLSTRGDSNKNDDVTNNDRSILKFQRRDLRRYLQFDDGYSECIIGPDENPIAFQLKRLKLEHLLYYANDAKRWTVKVTPRSPKSEPVENSELPIMDENVVPQLDIRNIKMDFTKLVSTCRLMTVTEQDFDGHATQILTQHLGNPDFEMKKSSDEHEYRALMCLGRLSSMGLLQYQKTVEEEAENVAQLNRVEFQSRNWTTAHLRLGEMQTLQMLMKVAFSHVQQLEEKLGDKSAPEVFIRDDPCPEEYLEALLDFPNQ